MSFELRHCWLQKHPTPSAAAGEFHWHGEGAPLPDDAALRGRVVEEVQKLAAPAVWWELSPRRVIWAAVFSATSPTDARPYRGVALSVITSAATGDASVAEMLAQLQIAAAAPWGVALATTAAAMPAAEMPAAEMPAATMVRERGPHRAELARAVLSGGAATVDDPRAVWLPAQLAQLVRALPAALQDRPVSGQITDAATTMLQHDGKDAVAELLAQVADGDGQAAAAWRLLGELAQSDPRAGAAAKAMRAEVLTALLDEILGESQRVLDVRFPDRATRRFERALRAWAAPRPGAPANQTSSPASWRQLLHGWGRGWLGDDAALTARLAEELALRALAELCRGGEAEPVLAEARWQALLPAARRQALWRELARRAPSLADSSPFSRHSPRSRQETFHAT